MNFCGHSKRKINKQQTLISYMLRKELESKYGKKLIKKIFDEGYLRGCTMVITKKGDDIPECDITRAIREMKGEKIRKYDWD